MTTQKPVDINSASADELDAVPGLNGHGYEIVRYREERGGFDTVRQLAEVPGMTATAEEFGDVLTAGNA